MPEASAREIGPLSAVPRLHHESAPSPRQIRSEALPDMAGAEFRFTVPLGAIDEEVADYLVEALAAAAANFCNARDGVRSSVAAAREIASAAFQRHPAPSCRPA